MINRRRFLVSSSTLLVSYLLSGCDSESSDLQIALLQGSLPLQLISGLSQQSNQLGRIKLKTKSNLKELYDLLLTQQGKTALIKENKLSFRLPKFSKKSSTKNNDLVTLGNYWLTSAVKEQLIEPLEIKSLNNWQKISPSFQKLVTTNNQNNSSEIEQIWGAPYRWGFTMIAYRNDKFKSLGWQPRDWNDLWNEDIKDRFSLLNQPREVIGLILKKLGYSYNYEDIESIDGLLNQLQTLHQQVKFYDSQNYLQPLILGDTWLAVGWSTDILPIVERYNNISAIVPISGTALWADMWVKPKAKIENTDLDQKIYQWIDFCWQTKSTKQINLFTKGMSPIEVSNNIKDQHLPITLDILNKSEFIEHLSPSSSPQYQKMWEQLIMNNE